MRDDLGFIRGFPSSPDEANSSPVLPLRSGRLGLRLEKRNQGGNNKERKNHYNEGEWGIKGKALRW